MIKNWKKNLSLLNHKIELARNLKKHLDIVSEKLPEESPEEPKKLDSVAQIIAKRKINQEKAFVNAVANIPAYKSTDYYTLDLINRKYKNVGGILHSNSVKLAKNRLAQIITKLLAEKK